MALKCKIHFLKRAEDKCCICNEYFCQSCLNLEDELTFCKKHLDLFQKNKWKVIFNKELDPDNLDYGVEIYELKKKLWLDNETPVIIRSKYKIPENSDQIISIIQVECLLDDYDSLLTKLTT